MLKTLSRRIAPLFPTRSGPDLTLPVCETGVESQDLTRGGITLSESARALRPSIPHVVDTTSDDVTPPMPELPNLEPFHEMILGPPPYPPTEYWSTFINAQVKVNSNTSSLLQASHLFTPFIFPIRRKFLHTTTITRTVTPRVPNARCLFARPSSRPVRQRVYTFCEQRRSGCPASDLWRGHRPKQLDDRRGVAQLR